MDEEREGRRFPKSDGEQQDEEAQKDEKDTEGQSFRGNAHNEDEEDSDDQGNKGDKKGHMGWSDASLKHEVRAIGDATTRLGRLIR